MLQLYVASISCSNIPRSSPLFYIKVSFACPCSNGLGKDESVSNTYALELSGQGAA